MFRRVLLLYALSSSFKLLVLVVVVVVVVVTTLGWRCLNTNFFLRGASLSDACNTVPTHSTILQLLLLMLSMTWMLHRWCDGTDDFLLHQN